jgi:hypothetical protein
MNEAIRRGDYFDEDGKGVTNDAMIVKVVHQVWHQYEEFDSGHLDKGTFR